MKKILLIVGMLMLCASCGSNAVVSDKQSTGTGENIQQLQNYKVGDECFVKNDDGEYKIVITGVEETDYRNEFSDKQADRVIIISYTYENISCSDDLYVSDSLNFKCYDAEGNSMETYPANVTYPQDISAGRKCSAQAAYALNNAENHVELEFYDNIFNSNADCMFVLEW